MKKIINVLLACLLGFSIVACSSEDAFKEEDITMDEILEKMDAKEDFVVIVERDGCTFCEAIQEYIEESKDEHPGITLYKLDTTDFELQKETEESTTLVSTTTDGKNFLKIAPYFYYTPTIYKFTNGEITDCGVGFSKSLKTINLWDLDSTPDLENADTQDFWKFIE